MNRSGIGFDDIYPGWKDEAKDIEYAIKPIKSNFTKHITIMKATGVPIPDESKVNRKSEITGREVRACIFNRTTGKFVGGTSNFSAQWTDRYEDWWTFGAAKKYENSMICKMADYETENASMMARSDLYVVFELVIFFKKNNIELQMSCG